LGAAIIYIINASKITFDFAMHQGLILSANIRLTDIISISIIVIIVSVIASLQPAFKASRMEPITALRHV